MLCGVCCQAIDKRVQDASLLAVPSPHHRRGYPTLEFNRDATVVAQLKRVRQMLPTTNPWTMLNFLARPDVGSMGTSRSTSSGRGAVDQVVETAPRLGIQGA